MQKELEAISEKIPPIEQWAHLFGDFLEPILPEKCTNILETIRDLLMAFTALRPFMRADPSLVVPLLTAVRHSEELAVQLASYREVCRRTALRYLRQRQHIAAYLSLLATEMGEVLMVTRYQPTAPTLLPVRQQQAHLHMVSNQEKDEQETETKVDREREMQ